MQDFNFLRLRVDLELDGGELILREIRLPRVDDFQKEGSAQAQRSNVHVLPTR